MNRSNAKRRTCAAGAWIALLVLALGICSGCEDEESLHVFRDAAAATLEQGVSAIFDGLIEGAFAVATMGDDAATREEQAAETGG